MSLAGKLPGPAAPDPNLRVAAPRGRTEEGMQGDGISVANRMALL